MKEKKEGGKKEFAPPPIFTTDRRLCSCQTTIPYHYVPYLSRSVCGELPKTSRVRRLQRLEGKTEDEVRTPHLSEVWNWHVLLYF